ncbi:hypothetical protein BIY22_07680 [Vibrio panuliri]|uniref:Uncharacterized protein n=1 Tax=Vibrio panuliri TaxID=1381081 RepID=A0A1Q9HE87_9VIBR|nr:hypothetical protein [Vibrio panuliri]OLQ88043.1 hypothetical protein BIY22_07680 [Vibrio panuliri]
MKSTWLSVAGAFVLTACSTTPTTNIAEFGLSIGNVTDEINISLDELSSLSLQSQADSLAYLTLDQSREQVCAGSASQIIQGEVIVNPAECNIPLRLTDLDSIVDPASPERRKQMLILQANRQLAEYAKALTDLANVSSKVEIQQSALTLTSSVSSLNDAYLLLSYAQHAERETIITSKQAQFEQNESLIATSVAGFASAITEEKRRAALKDVINQGDQVITKLVPIIVSELNRSKLHQTKATMELSALTDDLIQYNQASVKKPLKHDKAAKSIAEFHQRYLEIQAAALKDKQLVNAFEQIAQSHHQITEQVNKDRFSSKEIVASVSQLNKHYKDLNSFKKLIESCSGKITKGEDGFLHCQS